MMKQMKLARANNDSNKRTKEEGVSELATPAPSSKKRRKNRERGSARKSSDGPRKSLHTL